LDFANVNLKNNVYRLFILNQRKINRKYLSHDI